ncbi:hypothetical protein [Yersinia enterocolitica]
MTKLQKLFIEERHNLEPWEAPPLASLIRISKKCGRDEIAAAHISIMYLKSELAMTSDWDGDTQDDIWKTIEQLKQLLKLI